MTRHDYNPARSTNKLLLNEAHNKLSTCLCCCPSPTTLYGHIQCDHNGAFCEDDCDGTENPLSNPIQYSENIQDNCIDWDILTAPALDLSCSEGTGLPQRNFAVDSAVHCYRQNKYRADLCFGNPADLDPYDCNEGGYLNLEPITQIICGDWDPELKNFLLDFGYIEPPNCGNMCGFRFFINEDPSGLSPPPLLAMSLDSDTYDFFA